MTSLDSCFRVGDQYRIEKIVGDDAIAQRLMELGALDGEEIEVIGLAPFGDPIEISLRGYRLSLRKSEAARVLVSCLSEPKGGTP